MPCSTWCKSARAHLKQVLAKALTLVVLMHVEIKNTYGLYLTEGPSLHSYEEPFAAGLDTTKDSQSAPQTSLHFQAAVLKGWTRAEKATD